MADDQKAIVQRMIDAGESEENIAEVIRHFQTQQPAATAQPQAQPEGVLTGLVKGAVKGAANTAIGLGQMVHEIPGVSRVVDAIYGTPGLSEASFPAAREAVKPTTTPQKIGYAAEQVGEFFTPLGAAGKAGKAVGVAKSVGLTQAQTDSPVASGVSGLITAALPGGSAAARASSALTHSAEKSVAQALGATKEWAKTEAARLAPEVIKRGIGGSRQAMLDLAEQSSARVGQDLNAAIKTAAEAGETISGDAIRDGLGIVRGTFLTPMANGNRVAIPGSEKVVRKLANLDNFVRDLGPDIPIDQAVQVRRMWDKIVDEAGLFGRQGTASGAESAGAYATKQASDAFRKLINESPSLEKLNKESSFWQGLRDVLDETRTRTQAQSSGLAQAIQSGAGATVGGMFGDSAGDRFKNAVLGGIAGRQLVSVLKSPTWATRVAAPFKSMLASALASGSAKRVEAVTKTILRAMPTAFRPSEDTE